MSSYITPFQEVAEHFGLTLSAATEGSGAACEVVVLDGAFQGVDVHVYRATAPLDARWTYVWVRATRAVPGDFGLSITMSTRAGAFFARLFGSHVVETGDPAIDRGFKVKGTEAERVRALLTPELRTAVVAARTAARADASAHSSLLWGLWADDEHVYLELSPEAWKFKMFNRKIAVDELEAALAIVTSLARRLDAAAEQAPPSSVFAAHVPAWRAFAEARGLALSPSPLRISGMSGAVVARALATLDGDHLVELRRPFATPLPFFLRLKPHHRFDLYSWDPDGPHERTGDKAFDSAFSLLTSDLAAARAFLSEPVRGSLLALHEREALVFVDSQGVAVHRRDLDPSTFEPVLAAMAVGSMA